MHRSMQVIKSTWRYANMIVCATYADKSLLGFTQIVNIAQIYADVDIWARLCRPDCLFCSLRHISAHSDTFLLMQTFVCSALYRKYKTNMWRLFFPDGSYSFAARLKIKRKKEDPVKMSVGPKMQGAMLKDLTRGKEYPPVSVHPTILIRHVNTGL